MPIDVVAEVMANARLSPDYNVVAFAAPELARQALPGQFVMVKPAAGLDPLLRRPFSIFELVRDVGGGFRGISLLNKHVGIATAMLYDAQPGDRWLVLGPLGQPFIPIDPPSEAWMVAGGVGLAPFASLAEALAERGTPMTLFYGGRSARDLYYESFFRDLGARLIVSTDDGSRGEAGRVTEPVRRALEAASPGQPITLYACGPTPMMRVIADLGARAGRPVFVSLEPVMGCGMGGCYSCVVRVRRGDGSHFVRSCLEGPVFDARAVIWEALGQGH
jgi:dihydroorotate dehydrogenase electron transfer subunit